MFHNIIKILVSDLSSSQRIQRSTSLIKDLESRAKRQSQNQMPSYQAELESEAKPSAIKSMNPSLKADVPEASATSQKPVPNATAGVKDDKSSRSEFCCFFRFSSIQRKRKFRSVSPQLHIYPSFSVSFDYLTFEPKNFYQFSWGAFKANISIRVFLTLFNYLPSEVKEFKPVFSEHPKSQCQSSSLLFSS